jgi:hypothetical protein
MEGVLEVAGRRIDFAGGQVCSSTLHQRIDVVAVLGEDRRHEILSLLGIAVHQSQLSQNAPCRQITWIIVENLSQRAFRFGALPDEYVELAGSEAFARSRGRWRCRSGGLVRGCGSRRRSEGGEHGSRLDRLGIIR